MIIATAGHVDHGKTSLVKALTGSDTDRLAEEQRRGMSIDLGFAYATLCADEAEPAAAQAPLCFIDVPGHERFMRNMLAGVAAIDLGLLVVAADDGPMPQTHEHLAVLSLLAVPRLVLVLSKADRVEAQRLVAVRQQLTALLADTAYAGAPVFALSSLTGDGLPALRTHLAEQARRWEQRPVAGHFRLAVDRSFLLPGAGRVVTGTVLSGQVAVGELLRYGAAGHGVRVRGLHAHNQQAHSASAGQRCALNLAGPALRSAPPQRGDWLLAPPAHSPTQRLEVQLQLLPGVAGPGPLRAALQLHLGAAAVGARLQPLVAELPPAGQPFWARLLLAQPVAAAWGDRFILRDPAANQTLAGGWVVDPVPPQRGQPAAARLLQLRAMVQPEPKQALCGLLALAPHGVALAGFALARNLRPDELREMCQRLNLRQVSAESGQLVLTEAAWLAWQQQTLAALARHHEQQPQQLGASQARIRSLLGLAARPVASQAAQRCLLQAALAELVAMGQVLREGLSHRLPGHQPRLAEADATLLARLEPLLPVDDLRPPIVGELASELGLDLAELLQGLGRLSEQGRLLRVAPNRWYRPQTVGQLWAHAQALAAASDDGGLDAAGYRDATGTGRNLAVQVLEFLDQQGLMRFDGRRHKLLDQAQRQAAFKPPDEASC